MHRPIAKIWVQIVRESKTRANATGCGEEREMVFISRVHTDGHGDGPGRHRPEADPGDV